jgi:hypothetical protein
VFRVKAGDAEDAGGLSAALSITDHLLRRSEPTGCADIVAKVQNCPVIIFSP